MSKLENKQCPFFQKECLIEMCAMYDGRLDNCTIQLIMYNLYKLYITLMNGMSEGNKNNPPPSPFSPRA